MLRSKAAPVRFAEVTNTASSSATTALAWRTPPGYDRESHSITLYIPEEAYPRTLERALLHAMIHAAVPQDGHCAPFRAELHRVAEAGSDDADAEVWRMVCDMVWEDGWIGDESGRWERYREEHRDDSVCCLCSGCWPRNPTAAELAAAAETNSNPFTLYGRGMTTT